MVVLGWLFGIVVAIVVIAIAVVVPQPLLPQIAAATWRWCAPASAASAS